MAKVRTISIEGSKNVPVFLDRRLDETDERKAAAVFCIAGSKRILGKIRRIKVNSVAQRLSDAALQGLIYSKQAEIALDMYIWSGGVKAIPENIYKLLKKAVCWRQLEDLSYQFGGLRYLQLIRETDNQNAEKRITRLMEQEDEASLFDYFMAYFPDMLPWLAVCALIISRL
jgi:hypothetical protein